MEVSSDHVGAFTKVIETEVSARLSMNYAASIGDNNPLYFDDTRPGGIVATPLLSVALTWPFSGNFLQTWVAESFPHPFPYHIMERQVHFSETLIWHTVMYPGDRLVMQGHMAAILPHRAGTQLVVRYDAKRSDGQPVFTEYIGALLRRVKCTDAGTGSENLPKIPQPPRDAAPLWESIIPIDPLAAHVYDGCTNMHFPIHTSVAFARSVGLQGIILQGTATLSFAARELVNREAGGDPSRLHELSCQFTGMVTPGTTITVRLLHREPHGDGEDLFFDVITPNGKRAISGGHARLRPSLL